ncbi:TonB-dependent receptor [Pontibacter akesuensis]|uniref:Outer membrane receptor proteins, mostly Fe transport n=1 Tax=Pontibacter akesuensis TaxID=388950 RepID=A0A1I7G2L8_9BACT|nr:TonB-dependent receptor [Pontibacter akesuensis]GHA59171.1 collagen-binding protein [Pontibacter akesuensis]SFU42692.1 Outer membrane receptor proteins, mostly Fe transport [Pontibacter akesuensis]
MPKSNYFFILLLGLLFVVPPAVAQQLHTLSGRVLDANSGETLAGAAVSLKESPSAGAVTDAAGRYSFVAPTGRYTLVSRSIGYDAKEQPLQLTKNTFLDITLSPTAYDVQEVQITAERQPPMKETAVMGQLELPLETIKTLPVLFGEVDIMRTVQLLPGVKSAGEGSTGFYVRGGGADQNLVLLDQATVYNPGHLFNFFSVFNSDAIGNTTLIKGNMPARYGGRLSSVLDIGMKEGDYSNFRADGGIGLIASRLSLQGPIVEDKASFILSGRRTYVDVLLNPFLQNTEQGGVPYHFYDVNGKLSFRASDKDKLSLSGYYGRDVGAFTLSDGRFTSEFFWGNNSATARWDHAFSDKLEMDVSAIMSNYDFQFTGNFAGFSTILKTGISDYSTQVNFNYKPNVRHHLQYGMQYTYHILRPRTGEAAGDAGETFGTDRIRNKYGHEAAIYLSDDFYVTDKLLLSLGLRHSYFGQTGPFTLYQFNENQVVTGSTNYGSGESVASYRSWEPRVSLNYELSNNAALKAAFTKSAQYLHLVSNAYTTLPLDVWVPSSALVEPQFSTQYAIGYFRSMKDNQYEGSVEVYYKDLENQLEYREGFSPGPSNRDLEYEFVSGKGKSYGVELFLRKNYGSLQGWMGYTLSRTTRNFPQLNEGNTFPARYDRRHDLSLVGSYKYNDRWTFGGSFVYGTGEATTMPERRYFLEGTVNYRYGDRNSFRMEPTHRLDLSATLEGKKWKNIENSWTFSVYNVYGRKNPYLYYIDNEGDAFDSSVKLQAKKVSIVPFPLPSVTLNFSWK